MKVGHDKSFGSIPAWCYSRPMRFFHVVMCAGMLFGVFVLFPERFLFLAQLRANLPRSLYLLGVLWLLGGSLFYAFWFLGLAVFDRHYKKTHHQHKQP
jgi:hypothetical protein